MTTPDPAAASAAPAPAEPNAAAPAPAAPSAPSGGQPTHVTKPESAGYQAANPGEPDPAAAKPEAKPDGAAMKAYLVEKTEDGKTALEGKTDAEIEALYGELKTKEASEAPAFKIPDEHKDKSWSKKVTSQEDLYKQLDNLTALAGKKSIVPNLKDATPEEREAFYSQLRGKDATEYPIPDNPAFPTPAETQPAVAKLFMDNGVNPVQAEAIIKGYQELGAKQVAEQFSDEGFKASMETAFGPEWEKTTGAVFNTIKGMMNEDDQKAINHIPNSILGVVYRTLGNTIKAVDTTLQKYGAKETFAHLSAPAGQVAPTDIGSQRQAWRNELASMTMRPHTEAEKKIIIDKISNSYSNDPRLNQV